jgi:hypothetical protein
MDHFQPNPIFPENLKFPHKKREKYKRYLISTKTPGNPQHKTLEIHPSCPEKKKEKRKKLPLNIVRIAFLLILKNTFRKFMR